MKRRLFLNVSVTSALGLLLPVSFCTSYIGFMETILSTPHTLSEIFNLDSINEFGKIYLSEYSSVVSKKEISIVLLERVNFDGTDTNVLGKKLIEHIKNDFDTNRIIKLNGWIFSETELYQCALSYLLKK